jgi:hypothetical protein
MAPARTSSIFRLLTGLFCAVAAVGCSQKTPAALDKDEVRATFLRYKDAVVAGDGSAACRELSRRTLDYYGELRDSALRATPDELAESSLARQFEVLRLRDRLTATELESMSGAQLAEAYVNRGWMNSELMSRLTVGFVIHKGDVAEARFGDGPALFPSRLVFHREEGAWRFDLSVSPMIESKGFQQAFEESELDRVSFLNQLLAGTQPKRPVESLWEPLAASETL